MTGAKFFLCLQSLDFISRREPRLWQLTFTNDAFITLVAVSQDNKPVQVPAVVPETMQEYVVAEGAEQRRNRRLLMRKELEKSLRDASIS